MWMICISLNICIWLILFHSYRKLTSDRRDKRFYILVMVATVLVLMAVYYWSLHTRRMIYYWDYSNYYAIQIRTNRLAQLPFFKLVREIIDSIWYDDYNCFICLFCVLPFQLLKIHTVDAYIGLYYCLLVIPTLLAMGLCLTRLLEVFQVQSRRWTFVLTYVGVACCPLLHAASLKGQPDILGVMFCFLLIFYICDYEFEQIEICRWGILILLTEMLIMTRRWYLFWIVAFWISNGLRVLWCSREKLLVRFRNLALFGSAGIVIVGGSLFRFWKRILCDNYAADYSFYNNGGLRTEWKTQFAYMGYVGALVIMIALLLALVTHKTRKTAAVVALNFLLAIILFTQIQNAGEHQSLIFLCCYLVIVYLGCCCAKKISLVLAAVWCMTSVLGLGIALAGYSGRAGLTMVDLKPVVREDYEDISEVYGFIQEQVVDQEERMHIIPHGSVYNPDTFRNFEAPETLASYIPYGSAVSGVHYFPEDFCTAKYVMTCDPLDDLTSEPDSIVKTLNQSLQYLTERGKFVLARQFEFQNGTMFYCYERVEPVDNEEIDYLEQQFAALSDRYPDRWEEILEEIRERIEE